MASSPLSQPGSDSPVGQPPVELQATGPGLLEVVLVAAPFVLPVAAAIYLGYRLRARAAAGASWAPPPS